MSLFPELFRLSDVSFAFAVSDEPTRFLSWHLRIFIQSRCSVLVLRHLLEQKKFNKKTQENSAGKTPHPAPAWTRWCHYLSNSLVLVHSCVPLLITIKKSCVSTKGTRSLLYPNFFFLWSRKWPKSMWNSCEHTEWDTLNFSRKKLKYTDEVSHTKTLSCNCYLPVIFDHDVAIVPIPDAQDKRGHAVARARPREQIDGLVVPEAPKQKQKLFDAILQTHADIHTKHHLSWEPSLTSLPCSYPWATDVECGCWTAAPPLGLLCTGSAWWCESSSPPRSNPHSHR